MARQARPESTKGWSVRGQYININYQILVWPQALYWGDFCRYDILANASSCDFEKVKTCLAGGGIKQEAFCYITKFYLTGYLIAANVYRATLAYLSIPEYDDVSSSASKGVS